MKAPLSTSCPLSQLHKLRVKQKAVKCGEVPKPGREVLVLMAHKRIATTHAFDGAWSVVAPA